MKNIFIVILITLLFKVQHTNASQNVTLLKSNTNRLNVDFEVKDNKNPDSQILNSINLDDYEQFRQANARVQVADNNSGYILILYSQKETDRNRARLAPVHKFQSQTGKLEKAIK